MTVERTAGPADEQAVEQASDHAAEHAGAAGGSGDERGDPRAAGAPAVPTRPSAGGLVDDDLRGHYAGFVSRAIAFVIDSVAVTLGLAVFGWVTTLVLGVFDDSINATTFPDVNTLGRVAIVLSVPIAFAWYCAVCWATLGKTIGMGLLGLRVVRADGHIPGFFRALLRAFAYWISAILFLGFLWVLVDRRRQGWHDKIARTFVVYDWKAKIADRLARPDVELLVPHD